MFPILEQEHLGSCKWNSTIGYKVCNGKVLGCMIECGNRISGVQQGAQ
jgi:hypothetical protein